MKKILIIMVGSQPHINQPREQAKEKKINVRYSKLLSGYFYTFLSSSKKTNID